MTHGRVGAVQAIAGVAIVCQALLLRERDPGALISVTIFEVMLMLAAFAVRERELRLHDRGVITVMCLGPSWALALVSFVTLAAAKQSWLVAAAGLVGVVAGALGHVLLNPDGRAPPAASAAYRGIRLMPLGAALHGLGVAAVVFAGRSALPVVPTALLVVCLGGWATLLVNDE